MLSLKLLTAAVTLLTVIVGTRGDTWDKKCGRPTRTGFFLVGLGVLLFGLGAADLLVSESRTEQDRISAAIEKADAVAAAEAQKDEVITAVKDSNDELRNQAQDLRAALVRTGLYQSGISSIEIHLEHPESSQVLRNYEYIFVFVGKGTPWGFTVHGRSLSFFSGTSVLDNILAGVTLPFSLEDLGDSGLVDDYNFLSPSSYVSTDTRSLFVRAQADSLAVEDGRIPIYVGRQDVQGSTHVILKVAGGDLGKTITMTKVSISLNGRQPIFLIDGSKELTFGEGDTRLGVPYASTSAEIQDAWL